MKLTIYHAAVDGDCGTESHVFPTEAARNAWLRSIIEYELEGTSAEEEHVADIRHHLNNNRVACAWTIFEDHVKDPLDTYDLEATEIDVEPNNDLLSVLMELEQHARNYGGVPASATLLWQKVRTAITNALS